MGTLIVNGVHWLKRLMDSIDYPVENYVIFNNNGRGQITKELEELVSAPHPFIKNIKLCHLPANIGCGGGWNLIIKSYLMSPYWFIVSHDVAFTPGFLEVMAQKAENPEVGIIHGKTTSEHEFGAWDLFLIKDWVIQSHGLFDENLYPAYDEDIDYILRTISSAVKRDFVDVPHLHGDKGYKESGSQTWRTDLSLKDKLTFSREINESEYICKKWGNGWHNFNPTRTPFNRDLPISHTTYDLAFVRSKYLGF